MARGSLRQKLRTLLAERHLNGAVAVLVDGLHLGDAIRQHLDDGYRNRLARIREDASHAGLAANKSNAHDCPFVQRTRIQLPARGVARPREVNQGERGARTCPRSSSGLGSIESERLAQ